MKQKFAKFQCKHCKTIEIFREDQDGIRLSDVNAVLCPRCAAKGKKRKMFEITETRQVIK